MTGEQWWAVLLDGSVGLVGVFIALWLTIRHERTLATKAQDLERELAAQALTSERERAVRARIDDALVSAIQYLNMPTRGGPQEVHQGLFEVTSRLATFRVSAQRSDPFASAWTNNLTQLLFKAFVVDAEEFAARVRTDVKAQPRWQRVELVRQELLLGLEHLATEEATQQLLIACLGRASAAQWPGGDPWAPSSTS
ncbi:hypothetical protein [Cellulomonas terrae]|uniref:Uncharacterized protein n=1 Tax=Cellulomonas terrae TaxID=311234 RepID=A0A511JPC1_9CELL|nr:hypothetical protein [Cellulomonas terrae]GEL99881.1 hypothetical protein CTE05_34280 [Cellulomonas terrae]